MSIRFSWLSNAPWAASGYGQQTRINVHRLANEKTGNFAGIICYYGLEGGMMGISPNITCFPKRMHPYGADVFYGHSQAFGAQVAFSLTDVWVVEPENFPLGFKWIPWYPVDHEPMPPGVRLKLNNAWKRIAMSKFGETQTHLMGMECFYIPHGIETQIMKPMDKVACRQELGIPQDVFCMGMVAMNKGLPSRKNFVEQIAAYANIHRKHKDTYLYLQTEDGRNGGDLVNIPELCRSLGLEEEKDYKFCNQYNLAFGFPVEHMPKVYSALDVLLAVGAGEGFGIPIIEAQACGTPVIAGDWTAMSELVHGGSLIDKKDAFPQYSVFGAFLFRPHVRAIELAIEGIRKKTPVMGSTIQWIRDNYDADLVIERHWMPTFAAIEAAL